MLHKEENRTINMHEYTTLDGTIIRVGQNAKENDELTISSAPQHWWMHVAGYSGGHVVICDERDVLPKETRKDATVLAIYHSNAPDTKMSCVDMVRVEQTVWVRQAGKVKLQGEVKEFSIFMRRENDRIERLIKTKRVI